MKVDRVMASFEEAESSAAASIAVESKGRPMFEDKFELLARA